MPGRGIRRGNSVGRLVSQSPLPEIWNTVHPHVYRNFPVCVRLRCSAKLVGQPNEMSPGFHVRFIALHCTAQYCSVKHLPVLSSILLLTLREMVDIEGRRGNRRWIWCASDEKGEKERTAGRRQPEGLILLQNHRHHGRHQPSPLG